ncbi:MAG TPA: SAM-dependent chlorinase/fluorinase [Ktedonobacteraceae bacterium]|jgi:S-adenosylmethionine hydrolase|nr:SAM-dependent chlorinase/fluorinase [Ktedonobacteraceae bacterium]
MTQHISRPVIAVMTDFGSGDGDVGVMKGVMLGIAPDAQIIDITHDVAPQNVPSGAWILASAYRYFPRNTVFVCVVDPGVGSSRGAIALHAGDWFFVGPDNGLFSYVMAEQPVHGVVQLNNPAYHRPEVSSTFHGRDIFAPTGAHLALGTTEVLPKLGTQLDPATLVRLPTSQATRTGNMIDGHILHVDHFGNLITSIPLEMVPDLFDAPGIQAIFSQKGRTVNQVRRFFADGPVDGEPFIYGDSSGYVGIAVRNGSAAKTLGVGYGAAITLVIPRK